MKDGVQAADESRLCGLIPSRKIRDGVELARDVVAGPPGHGARCCAPGVRLSARYAMLLPKAGVGSVWIEDDLGESIDIAEPLTPETRAKVHHATGNALPAAGAALRSGSGMPHRGRRLARRRRLGDGPRPARLPRRGARARRPERVRRLHAPPQRPGDRPRPADRPPRLDHRRLDGLPRPPPLRPPRRPHAQARPRPARPRRRQARRAAGDPQQAGPADRRGDGGDEDPRRRRRRAAAPGRPLAARDLGRPRPPRAHRRLRLPARACTAPRSRSSRASPPSPTSTTPSPPSASTSPPRRRTWACASIRDGAGSQFCPMSCATSAPSSCPTRSATRSSCPTAAPASSPPSTSTSPGHRPTVRVMGRRGVEEFTVDMTVAGRPEPDRA